MKLASLSLVLLLVCATQAVPVNVAPEVKPGCAGCKALVGSMQDFVKSANETYEENCMEFLDSNLCEKLPADIQENCKSIVSQEIPDIWEQIINDYLDPKTTCDKLSFCAALEAPAPDVNCKLCKKAATWLDTNIFEDPDFEAKVAERLKEVCAKLADQGKDIEKKCEDIIDDDAADMMAHIGEQIATNLCKDVGACPSPGPSPNPKPHA